MLNLALTSSLSPNSEEGADGVKVDRHSVPNWDLQLADSSSQDFPACSPNSSPFPNCISLSRRWTLLEEGLGLTHLCDPLLRSSTADGMQFFPVLYFSYLPTSPHFLIFHNFPLSVFSSLPSFPLFFLFLFLFLLTYPLLSSYSKSTQWAPCIVLGFAESTLFALAELM